MSAVSIKNVSKSFNGKNVLEGISLEIPENTITAIIGPSGAGKSVMLKLITGLISVDEGEIAFEDENPALGILFQEAALFDSMTLYENVAFPLTYFRKCSKRETRERVWELLEETGAADIAGKFPSEVPIGARKRVGIARALVMRPSIILFDEPNTSLDPIAGQEVYELINKTKRHWKYTGLVISHEIPEVFQVSEQVAMLYCGKIIEQGTVEEFTASKNEIVRQFLEGRSEGPMK